MSEQSDAHSGQPYDHRDGKPQSTLRPVDEAMPWPFDADSFRLTMGLRAMPPECWTTVDSAYPALMAERGRLLETCRAAVLGRLPGTGAMEDELLARMVAHLEARYPGLVIREGGRLANGWTGRRNLDAAGDPLEALNGLAPEDYCLLRREAAGWVLAAAILCFPNRWRLGDKLGRPLPGVHGPVPGYDAALASPVDRFLDGLAPGRGVWRTNWALNDDPALFQPDETAHTAAHEDITPENAGARLFLRVERQSLVKLPDSGAVVFGIRTHQKPIEVLTPDEARQFAAVLRSVPPPSARYKGLHRTGPLALAVLDAQS